MAECFLCGRNGSVDPLDTHHIFGGANRKVSKKLGAEVQLCHHRCHLYGEHAVHQDADVAERLRQWGQQMVMDKMGWNTAQFVAEIGKNYLDDWVA